MINIEINNQPQRVLLSGVFALTILIVIFVALSYMDGEERVYGRVGSWQ